MRISRCYCCWVDCAIFDLLTELGADIHAPLSNGTTPMLIACERDHQQIVARLRMLQSSEHSHAESEATSSRASHPHGLHVLEAPPPTNLQQQQQLDDGQDEQTAVSKPSYVDGDQGRKSNNGSGGGVAAEWSRVQSWLSGALAAALVSTPVKVAAPASPTTPLGTRFDETRPLGNTAWVSAMWSTSSCGSTSTSGSEGDDADKLTLDTVL